MSLLVLACVGSSAVLPDSDPEIPVEFDGGDVDEVDPDRVRKMLEEDVDEDDDRGRGNPEKKEKPAAVLPEPDFFPRPTPQTTSDDDDDDDSENGGNGDEDDGEHASVRGLHEVTDPEGDWNRCGC